MNLQQILQSTLGSNPNRVDNSLGNILNGGNTKEEIAKFNQQHPTLGAFYNSVRDYNDANDTSNKATEVTGSMANKPVQPPRMPEGTGVNAYTISAFAPSSTDNTEQPVQQAQPSKLEQIMQQEGFQRQGNSNTYVNTTPAPAMPAQQTQDVQVNQPFARDLSGNTYTSEQDYLNNYKPNKQINDYIKLQVAQQTGTYTPYDTKIEEMKANPLYAKAQADPFSTDSKIQNFNSELSGLKLQQQQYLQEQKNKNDLFGNLLKDEFSRVQNSNMDPASKFEQLYKIGKAYSDYQLGKDKTSKADTQQQFENQFKDKQLETELEKQRIASEGTVNSALAKAQQKQLEEQVKKEAGFQLPATAVEKLSQTRAGISQLNGLMDSAKSLPDYLFQPGVAQASSFNPYDTSVHSFNQLVASTKQIIGKGLEGGVLRAEDEKKYEKIIPKLGDTREILAQKGQQLKNLLINKYVTEINGYKEAGYGIGTMPTSIPSSPSLNFNSEQEAEQANLPSGTVITINGRQAVIE